MLTFPRVDLSKLTVQMQELTMGEAIQLARMPNLLESRLTVFLGFALNDKALPLSLSIQERYLLLMTYQTCQKNTDLALQGDYSRYFLAANESRLWQESITQNNMTVSRLTGLKIEVLEKLCEDLPDWLLGAMAMQCDSIEFIPDWPVLSCAANETEIERIMRLRLALLESVADSDFDELYAGFLSASESLTGFVKTGFDDQGVIILGGTDDAISRRFLFWLV